MSDMELLLKAYEHEGSLRKLAEKTGKSPATWQTLMNGKYKFDPQKLFALIQREYAFLESDSVECPAIGEIHSEVCLKYSEASMEGKNLSDRIYSIVREQCKTCEKRKQ